jgi:hypothetical protein
MWGPTVASGSSPPNVKTPPDVPGLRRSPAIRDRLLTGRRIVNNFRLNRLIPAMVGCEPDAESRVRFPFLSIEPSARKGCPRERRI